MGAGYTSTRVSGIPGSRDSWVNPRHGTAKGLLPPRPPAGGLFPPSPQTRLSHLAVVKMSSFGSSTNHPRSRFTNELSVPVCGHRPWHFCVGFVRSGDRFGSQIADLRSDPHKFPRPLWLNRADTPLDFWGSAPSPPPPPEKGSRPVAIRTGICYTITLRPRNQVSTS